MLKCTVASYTRSRAQAKICTVSKCKSDKSPETSFVQFCVVLGCMVQVQFRVVGVEVHKLLVVMDDVYSYDFYWVVCHKRRIVPVQCLQF